MERKVKKKETKKLRIWKEGGNLKMKEKRFEREEKEDYEVEQETEWWKMNNH